MNVNTKLLKALRNVLKSNNYDRQVILENEKPSGRTYLLIRWVNMDFIARTTGGAVYSHAFMLEYYQNNEK